jgi:protein-S-isoprenylcysteine O-methyltransferase Ste14
MAPASWKTDYIIDNGYFETFIWSWIALGVVTFFYLFIQPAPYGRHQTKKWGPEIPSWLCWILMEAPSPLLISFFVYLGQPTSKAIGTWVLTALWLFHYTHRTLIQPLTNPGGSKPMPVLICGSAIFFNLINGYVNGRGLALNAPSYEIEWVTRPTTIIGLLVFAVGMYINRTADTTLLNLRKPGETGYKIPYGGLYEYISCPNYFGEMVEWTGFAISAWSLPAFSFAIWTVANLAPRAVLHHKWYLEKFPDYPKNRNALIPNPFASVPDKKTK